MASQHQEPIDEIGQEETLAPAQTESLSQDQPPAPPATPQLSRDERLKVARWKAALRVLDAKEHLAMPAAIIRGFMEEMIVEGVRSLNDDEMLEFTRRFIDETTFFSREAMSWKTKDVHILILDMITFGRPNIPNPALHHDPRTVLARILYGREFAATVTVLTQRSRSSSISDERSQGTPNTPANTSRAGQNQTTPPRATTRRQDSNQDVRVPPIPMHLMSDNSYTRQGTYSNSPDGGWTTGEKEVRGYYKHDSGKIRNPDSIREDLKVFQNLCECNGVSMEQMPKILYGATAGPIREELHARGGIPGTYEMAWNALTQKFDNEQTRKRAESKLNRLHFTHFIRTDIPRGDSLETAFQDLCSQVRALNSRCDPCFVNDKEKIKALRQALHDEQWARTAFLGQIHGTDNYENVIAKLDIALQDFLSDAPRKDSSIMWTSTEDDIPNRPAHRPRRYSNNPKPKKDKRQCFLCGSESHLKASCNASYAEKLRYQERRLKAGEKTSQIFLSLIDDEYTDVDEANESMSPSENEELLPVNTTSDREQETW